MTEVIEQREVELFELFALMQCFHDAEHGGYHAEAMVDFVDREVSGESETTSVPVYPKTLTLPVEVYDALHRVVEAVRKGAGIEIALASVRDAVSRTDDGRDGVLIVEDRTPDKGIDRVSVFVPRRQKIQHYSRYRGLVPQGQWWAKAPRQKSRVGLTAWHDVASRGVVMRGWTTQNGKAC